MTDTVTLPRSVVKQALEALKYEKDANNPLDWHHDKTMHALRAALEQPQDHPEQNLDMVPAGWKLVPTEPTPNMDEAAKHISVCREDVYRAMLDAAPQPPTAEKSSVVEQPQSVTDCHQSQPQGGQPTMTPVAQRKLDDLLTRGYQISGYSVYHDTKHQHGFVTTAGLVGWWKPEGAEYPQPRQPLTDDAATRLVQSVVAGSDRPIGMVAFGLLVARAVERAHGIGGDA